MSFGAPVWLWSLVLLPVLAGLYFLKVRPRRQQTNSFFLWEKVFEQTRSQALFKRLRDLWSLLLLLLAFLCVILAIADFRWTERSEENLIIIIDTSVSMQSRSGGQTRLDAAKLEAVKMVRALNGTRRAAIATADRTVRFHTHLTTNPKELLNAISTIQAADIGLNRLVIEDLVTSRLENAEQTQLCFLTDSREDFTELSERMQILMVGEASENLGIIAADLQWQPGLKDAAALYLRVTNQGVSRVDAELQVSNVLTGQIAKLIPISIEAGTTYEEVLTMEPVSEGLWSAHFVTEDGLEADNRVVFNLKTPEPIRVGLATQNEWFFQNSVYAFERSGGTLTMVTEAPEIIVVEGGAGVVDQAHTLIFAPSAEPSPWWMSVGDRLNVGLPVVKIPDHPILRYIDAENLRFSGARELVIPDSAIVLMETEAGMPLLYTASYEGRTGVVVNLDPAEDDFFLSPWFPVFVHSSAEYLSARQDMKRSTYATGSVYTLPKDTQGSWSLTLPDGGVSAWMPGDSVLLDQLGQYTFSRGTESFVLGTGLLSSMESLEVSALEMTDTAVIVASGWPASVWLIAVAILILCVESLMYHRRKVG